MSDGRTAVRDRNGLAILDAAIDTLIADPDAGMAEIAAAAGVGRATLYRHYETREELVSAIETRVRLTFVRLLAELEAEPHELERFVAGLVVLREGVASMATRRPRDEARVREFWKPMRRVIAALQADGTIDASLSTDWVMSVFRSLLRGTTEEIDAGHIRRDDAPALVVGAFRRAVAA